MRRLTHWFGTAAAGLALAVAGTAVAATRIVTPGTDALARAVASADTGDVLRLAPGTYHGPVVIDTPLTIDGADGVVIDGRGAGSVITVRAPGVVIQRLTVRNSGIDLSTMDSGVFVEKTAHDAVVARSRFDGNLFGVYLHGPDGATVRDSSFVGREDLRMSERGNGVSIWNSRGSAVTGNRFESGRDGIFVTTSRENLLADNSFYKLRFAIHYMYADDGEIRDNRSIANHAGYALMYSSRLRVTGNRSDGDRDHGILLNYANGAMIADNTVTGGGGKCVFIYNSSKNRFAGNRFEGCDIGVHFTAGSERNQFAGNAFIANRTQVKYVGTRWLDWSHDGRGNYWSDNPAFDLNGDGIADAAYRPNDLIDQVVWKHPTAKLLVTSPAVQLLRWMQSQFPGLHPGGVIDSAPLMRPPGRGG